MLNISCVLLENLVWNSFFTKPYNFRSAWLVNLSWTLTVSTWRILTLTCTDSWSTTPRRSYLPSIWPSTRCSSRNIQTRPWSTRYRSDPSTPTEPRTCGHLTQRVGYNIFVLQSMKSQLTIFSWREHKCMENYCHSPCIVVGVQRQKLIPFH